MKNLKNLGFHLVTAFAWLTASTICSQAVPTITNPPFVQNGSVVTTPGATGTYNSAEFESANLPFTVTISPAGGQTTTLNNTNSIVQVGAGSTITVDSGVTINETAGGNAALLITGAGTVTTAAALTSTSFNGIEIDGAGTVTNTGTVTAQNQAILITGAGTVVSSGAITSNGNTAIYINGDGNVTSSAAISGSNFAVFINGNGTVNNTSTITAHGNTAISIGGTGSVTSSGAIIGENFGIQINGSGTVINTAAVTGQGNTAISLGSGTVTNSGTVLGENFGIQINGAGTVTNSASVTGQGNTAITLGSGTVTNSGIVLGEDFGIQVNGAGTVTNSASVTGTNNTAVTLGSGTVTNSGTLIAEDYGIQVNGAGTITNSASVTGRTNTAITLGSGTVTNSGVVTGYDVGIQVSNGGTVNNSSSVTGQHNNAIEIDATGTVNNSGTLSGNDNGIVTYGVGTITNSGAITANNDGVYASGASSSVTINGGSITAGNNGVEFGGANSSVTMTSGSITGNGNDGVLFSGNGTLTMLSGTSISGSNDGVLIEGSGTANVAGTITSHVNVGLWYLGGMGNTTIAPTGVIMGASNGLETDGSGTLVNMGSITGVGNYGAYFGGTGTVTLNGGFISGPGSAIYTTGNASSIVINGRSTLSNGAGGPGLMYNNAGTGAITLNLVGMTPAQLTLFNAAKGTTSNDIFAGGEEYKWQNYLMSGNGVSLELVVDSGLNDVATRIDSLSTPLPLAYDPFYLAAVNNPEAALNSLVGREFDDAVGIIAVNTTTALSDVFDSRAFDLRSGTGGFDLSGLNVNSGSMIASLGQTQDVLSRMMGTSLLGGTTMSDSKEVMESEPLDTHRWGAWASGTVTLADESSTATGPGFTSTTGSPTIGVDYKITNHFALGVLANYSTTGANFADGSRLGVQTGLGALYGTWSDGPWYVNGIAGGGYSGYDNQRVTLAGTTANSSPDGNEILANFTGGYDFKLGNNWVVSPEAGLLYTHATEDSFTESGAGVFDLSQADQNIDSLRTKLGFHVMDNLKWDGITFTPQFRAAWYHECLDDSRGVSTSLPGAPALGSFVVKTNDQGRDFAIVGAGISATPSELHDNITFFINYDAQVGQDNYISHTVNGGLRVGF
jgi:outer membrane autotransporter protein